MNAELYRNCNKFVITLEIIIKYIERNFGGIEYEIDIDFKLDLQDMREKIDLIKKIIEDYETYRREDKITKLSSIFLFKIYVV